MSDTQREPKQWTKDTAAAHLGKIELEVQQAEQAHEMAKRLMNQTAERVFYWRGYLAASRETLIQAPVAVSKEVADGAP